MAFLEHRDGRPLRMEVPAGFQPMHLYLGSGAMALEVAVLSAQRKPTNQELRDLHAARLSRRATPIVVVVLWGNGRASIAGPKGGGLATVADCDRTQIERLCDAALNTPDRHGAIRLLSHALGQLDAPIPGLRNSGLFALHELEAGVPRRSDWQTGAEKARPLLSRRGRSVIEGLGYTIQTLPGPESVLVANGTKVAIALFLERPDEIEPANPLFGGLSPVSHALARADHENLDYVVILAGSTLRIYPVKTGIGTGRRGRTETFAELNLDLLSPAQAGYLWLLFSADALGAGGSFSSILQRSADYAADLGTRLRERVYKEVVPALATSIVKARRLRQLSSEHLRETYQMALHVLFRLLFVAYAEDNERLPLHQNESYRKHSLKETAKQLAETLARGTPFERQDFYWNEVTQLWKAVEKGNRAWGVPAYNGGLFASEEGPGAQLAALTLPDESFAPALAALLLDVTEEGTRGPIDFRPLGVREFGTIYEGLLESELSLAEIDLAIDPTDAYVPARGRATPVVRAGNVYLHNASGARKSSGAYYTKAFAVEHLLDRALEPALDEHLARLDAAYDAREAAARFFDFRVADIAMGSGHFLVAAVDRVERRFSNYLAKRPLAGVGDELERLRKTARDSLGSQWNGDPIEDTQLLRRQIARRCMFGVDLNPLAVELARLSLWIHTFVPGLPLSFLDANLVVGNSLVGIATFNEVARLLGAGGSDLFAFTATERLAQAREPLEKVARLADATAAEVKEARKLYSEARKRIAGEESLLTVLSASRIDESIRAAVKGGQVVTRLAAQGDVFSDALIRKAEVSLAGLDALHFPIVFPHVFLGERGGFDVMIGNPPWDKVRFEEDSFFVRYIPGLIGMPQVERKRAIARYLRDHPDQGRRMEAAKDRAQRLQTCFDRSAGAYEHQGSGHLDTAKLFAERMLTLRATRGRVGIVLPRQYLVLSGWADLRKAMFTASDTLVAQLKNRGGWVFDDAEHRYIIALTTIAARPGLSDQQSSVGIYPGADSPRALAVAERSDPLRWSLAYLKEHVSQDLQVPLLARPGEEQLLGRLLDHPRLGSTAARNLQSRPYAVIDVGKDLEEIGLDPSGAYLARTRSVLAFSTTPDEDCRRVSQAGVVRFLRQKLARADWGSADIARRDPQDVLSLVYRYPARNDDSRTLIATVLPPHVFPAVGYVHSLVTLAASPAERLCLLGFLNSIAWDWFARRFVDRHVVAHVLDLLPLPREVTRFDPTPIAVVAATLLELRESRPVKKWWEGTVRAMSEVSEDECEVLLNARVFRALDFSREERALVLDDFTDSGVPSELRERLLAATVPA